jgi:hypothetical protein
MEEGLAVQHLEAAQQKLHMQPSTMSPFAAINLTWQHFQGDFNPIESGE